MYFPYLRGKQYELLALKDFSQMSPNNAKIIPVIEPVKSQVNGLNSALEALRDNAMRFAVILNPKDGDFKKDRDNDYLKIYGSQGQTTDANNLKFVKMTDEEGNESKFLSFRDSMECYHSKSETYKGGFLLSIF